MEILSLNVGVPREIERHGRMVLTSIFKTPVSGRIHASRLHLEGDQQADLAVHGGVAKAIYAYPSEHYPSWLEDDPGLDLPWGAFGENFTTVGLSEETVSIGDRLRVGSAELQVTQPRLPCFKLALRLNRPDIGKPFLKSRRTGFYLAVVEEGDVQVGDPIEIVSRDERAVSVADVVSLFTTERQNQELLRRALEVPALPQPWRDHLLPQLR